jgi:hypothetical protein
MSTLEIVLIVWGIVTAILAALVIYRSTISMKETDQIFLSASEQNREQDQMAIQRSLARLASITKALGAASGILLAAGASLWFYQTISGR